VDRVQLEQAKIALREWAETVFKAAAQNPDEMEAWSPEDIRAAQAILAVLAALERLELRWDAVLELADRWDAAAARMRARYESLGAVSSVAQELERCAAELRSLGEPSGTTIPPTQGADDGDE
jgi:hypothetical protein